METIDGEQVATNKKDGSKVVLRDGKWIPYTPKGPSGFQKYFAAPATNAVANAIGGPFFSQSVIGGPPMIGSGAVPKSIAKAIVPQTPTQAAIDAAMLASGGLVGPAAEGAGLAAKLARPAMRMGIAALGGAAGSKAEGKSATSGATSGALQQGFGEIVAPAANLAGKIGKMALNREDVQRVGSFMRNLAPWLPSPKNVSEFDKVFRGGEATEKIGSRLGKYEKAISNRFGDTPIMKMQAPASTRGEQFATVTTDATFDDVVHRIKMLNDQARYNGPDSSLRWAAKHARQEAHELTQDLGAALNQQTPGLGSRYLAARRQYAGARLLSDIFSEPDLWKADGRIDMAKLQDLVANRGAAGYRDELTRIFGRDKTNQLLQKVYRDAPPTARDVPGGLSLGMSAHGIGIPRVFAHPHLPSSVGAVPRRFPKIPPTAPGLAAGQTINNLIQQITGNDQQ